MNSSDKLNVLGYIVTLLILLCYCANASDQWNGNWFPKKPGEIDPILDNNSIVGDDNQNNHDVDNDINNNKSSSSSSTNQIDGNLIYTKKMKTMGITDPKCDDAETNLWIDYDPKNISHHDRFLCMQNRKPFNPNPNTEPILREYTIPVEYSALHRCMNESISYDYNIPTFGTHRPVWPVYGEYSYVPVQRWLHNLEHGAIVAAYHPCVNIRQLDLFRKLVKKCLYRHIITPYEKLAAERPFALIAWGRSLEMSVIDIDIVVGFIRMNALQGPEKTSRNGQYSSGLIGQAQHVSDADDNNLCPLM